MPDHPVGAAHGAEGDEPLGDVATKVLFENDRVRVWENRLEPGERSPLHTHEHDYLIIDLEGDRIAVEPAPGQARGGKGYGYMEAPVRPGGVVYLSAGMTEQAVNVGRLVYRTILVELKDR